MKYGNVQFLGHPVQLCTRTFGASEPIAEHDVFLDGESGDSLGHAGDRPSNSQLVALHEAAKAPRELGRVESVQLAGKDLGVHLCQVVTVLVPPDLAAFVAIGVRHRHDPEKSVMSNE